MDKWLNNIDKGEITGAIFFDSRKAFDVVDHEILLQKRRLHKFDSHAMAWIQSYLSHRYQCIIKNRTSSSMQEVTSGVPQGSVLGPALFLTFINDMPLSKNEAYAEEYGKEILKIPFSRTTYYDKSFSVTGPRFWNSLPLELGQSSHLNSLKKALKSYLLHT